MSSSDSDSGVFRRLVDGLDWGVLITGPDQNVGYANAYSNRLFGIDLTGRSVESLRPLITKAAPSEDVLRGEVLVLNEPQGREARCWLTIAPLSRDHGTAGLVWTFFELTEEIVNIQAFIDLSAELASANRELRRRNDEMQALIRTDALTGLPSRRAILEVLSRALEFGRTSGQDVSVGLVAITGLKQLNQTKGLEEGDEALRRVGALVARELGADGTVGRLDSRFLMVMPGADLAQAKALAEAVRHAVQRGTGHANELTVAIGLASGARALAGAEAALSRARPEGVSE